MIASAPSAHIPHFQAAPPLSPRGPHANCLLPQCPPVSAPSAAVQEAWFLPRVSSLHQPPTTFLLLCLKTLVSLLTGLEEGGVQLPEAGLPPGLSPPGESLGGHTVDCYFLTGMPCPLPGRRCPLKHRLSGPNRKHMALMSRSGTSWRCSNSMLYPHKEQSLWGRGSPLTSVTPGLRESALRSPTLCRAPGRQHVSPTHPWP